MNLPVKPEPKQVIDVAAISRFAEVVFGYLEGWVSVRHLHREGPVHIRGSGQIQPRLDEHPARVGRVFLDPDIRPFWAVKPDPICRKRVVRCDVNVHLPERIGVDRVEQQPDLRHRIGLHLAAHSDDQRPGSQRFPVQQLHIGAARAGVRAPFAGAGRPGEAELVGPQRAVVLCRAGGRAVDPARPQDGSCGIVVRSSVCVSRRVVPKMLLDGLGLIRFQAQPEPAPFPCEGLPKGSLRPESHVPFIRIYPVLMSSKLPPSPDVVSATARLSL